MTLSITKLVGHCLIHFSLGPDPSFFAACMNKTTIGSSLIFVAEHCAWPFLHRYDEKHPLSHSMICGLLVSLFSANVSNSKIHIPQSLLLFSAYHLQSQIVYWISNIGLSGSQYAGRRGRRGGMFRKWSKMRWKWRSVARFDESRVVTGQFDCSQRWWIRQKTPPIPRWTE